MNKCYKCGKETNNGTRAAQGEFVCIDCATIYGTMHYDKYNAERKQMELPQLGKDPNDYVLNYTYQLFPQMNVAAFKKQYFRLLGENWSALDILRGIEYVYRVKKTAVRNYSNLLGILPFKLMEIQQYYKLVSNHHYTLYSKQTTQDYETVCVAVSHPTKPAPKLINMEAI